MVDSLFQGGQGMGATHNAILSSSEYLTQVRLVSRPDPFLFLPTLASNIPIGCLPRTFCHRPCGWTSPRPPTTTHNLFLVQAARQFNNIEDGFYISPAFLDKITIHVAKNFMDLPKIKVRRGIGMWRWLGTSCMRRCMSSALRQRGACTHAAFFCQLAEPISHCCGVMPLICCNSPLFAVLTDLPHAGRARRSPSSWVSGVARARARPSSAPWRTRSWASAPSSCPPESWSLATQVRTWDRGESLPRGLGCVFSVADPTILVGCRQRRVCPAANAHRAAELPPK